MKLLGLKLLGLFLFLGTTMNAQVVVRGVVKDSKSKEGVFNATIKINGNKSIDAAISNRDEAARIPDCQSVRVPCHSSLRLMLPHW